MDESKENEKGDNIRHSNEPNDREEMKKMEKMKQSEETNKRKEIKKTSKMRQPDDRREEIKNPVKKKKKFDNMTARGHITRWLDDDDLRRGIDLMYQLDMVPPDTYIFRPVYAEYLKIYDKDLSNCVPLFDLELPDNLRYFLIPVSDAVAGVAGLEGGSHWSLLSFDKEEAKFTYVDSKTTYRNGYEERFNEHMTQGLAKNLWSFLGNVAEPDPLPITIFPSEEQRNGSDCGLYVLAYMHNFLVHGHSYNNESLKESIDLLLDFLIGEVLKSFLLTS